MPMERLLRLVCRRERWMISLPASVRGSSHVGCVEALGWSQWRVHRLGGNNALVALNIAIILLLFEFCMCVII
jgi:hypothetical protein